MRRMNTIRQYLGTLALYLTNPLKSGAAGEFAPENICRRMSKKGEVGLLVRAMCVNQGLNQVASVAFLMG